jgi:hypothetical protein
MVIRRLSGEWTARLLLGLLIVGLFAAIVVGRRTSQAVEIHAVMPEKGGWLPGNLTAEVDVPLNLRLTSDDVMHGFAVGQQNWPAVDVKPGQVTELSLTFDEPGTYTYYCTRWCGPNHWRMRGSIEVTDEISGSSSTESAKQPLYISLGLDIDTAHEVDVRLERSPSATAGKALDFSLPSQFIDQVIYLEQTPFDLWTALRADPKTASLSDADVWDLVAFVWRSQVRTESLLLGQQLYTQNCAACHGENGDGEGPGADALASQGMGQRDAMATPSGPTAFSDPRTMLGGTGEVFYAKIRRGGMGTGMPGFGPLFTPEETWALVDLLWSFVFDN